jgi:hypothetical protein
VRCVVEPRPGIGRGEPKVVAGAVAQPSERGLVVCSIRDLVIWSFGGRRG